MKRSTRAKRYYSAIVWGRERQVQRSHCAIVTDKWCPAQSCECESGGILFSYKENGCTFDRCAEKQYKLKEITEEQAAVLNL